MRRYDAKSFCALLAKGKTPIFVTHHLLVEVVILVSAILSVKILNVRSVGRGNACATKINEEHIGIPIKEKVTGEMIGADVGRFSKLVND